MEGRDQILSLWVGSHSQKAAHYFYSLQAEQFFDPVEDPVNHHALWDFKDKDMELKYPRAIIYDTSSDHLTRIRKVNHRKMLKKLKEPTKEQMQFNFQFIEPEQQQQPEDPTAFLYQNWEATQNNYSLIDNKFHDQEKVCYQLWQDLFRNEADTYQDKIRRYLQRSDCINMFSICSDGQKLGFTTKVLQYLKDECSKKTIAFINLSTACQQYSSEVVLPLLGHINQEVNLLVDIQNRTLINPYFENDCFFDSLSPFLNSFLTPFMLKDNSSAEFVYRINSQINPLFNLAFTLPLISQENQLNQYTNIFDFLAPHQPQENASHNRINMANNTFAYISQPFYNKNILKFVNNPGRLEKVTSKYSDLYYESYVLKGQIKDIRQVFPPRQNVDLKYLIGVMAANQRQQLKYSPFYRDQYALVVESYPFHTCMFQHRSFGPSIRNYLRTNPKASGHQLLEEWRERSYALADKFSQEATNSD